MKLKCVGDPTSKGSFALVRLRLELNLSMTLLLEFDIIITSVRLSITRYQQYYKQPGLTIQWVSLLNEFQQIQNQLLKLLELLNM